MDRPASCRSSDTRYLIQENARSHGHIEGLHAAGQRYSDPPIGGGRHRCSHPGAFVSHHQRHRRPVRPPCLLPPTTVPCCISHPDLAPLEPRPGHKLIRCRGDGRQTEAGSHGTTDHLGVREIGRALERDQSGGTQSECRPEHCPYISRVLHSVEHEDGGAWVHSDVIEGPAFRLDHRDNALRVLGIRQFLQLRIADLVQRNAGAEERCFQCFPASSTFQRRGDCSPRHGDTGSQCLLYQTHAFGQSQAAPLSASPAVQITNQRLKGAAHGDAHPMKIALTIAGSDSGGGAGIQADLKTFHQFGVFGTSVIVALTAQNTQTVRAIEAVPEAMVRAQLIAISEDLPPAALKTGMLADAGLVRQVARAIRENEWAPLVVDPVMVSTTGTRLLSAEAEEVIREDLLPLAALVTPNLDEAAILTSRMVHDVPTMERAGATLLRLGAGAALVKGGHLSGDDITDVLVTPDGIRHFTRPRIDTRSVHGTGCTLSAAITAGFALGWPLEAAVASGLDFVHRAIAAAPGIGGGFGPLNHTVAA